MAKRTQDQERELEATAPYVVESPLRHDGVDYEVGVVVELADRFALPLLAMAVVAAPTPQGGDAPIAGEAPQA